MRLKENTTFFILSQTIVILFQHLVKTQCSDGFEVMMGYLLYICKTTDLCSYSSFMLNSNLEFGLFTSSKTWTGKKANG